MTPEIPHDGAWFIYDGDCPLCRNAAMALRLRKSLGTLHLLNARQVEGHTLMTEIKARRLDLDQGMVIYHDGRFFHGRDALHFMAVHGAPDGLFNRLNRLLFQLPAVAGRLYPFLRGIRNMLLKLLGRHKIDNLTDRNAPTFKAIFGASWEQLPDVMLKHSGTAPIRTTATASPAP